MSSKTEILNMALSHIGIGEEVGNIGTEKSEEAQAGRRFYDIASQVVSTAIPWPFLTKIQALALIETEPNTEWGYSYRYPSDCTNIRRILSGVRNDSRQTRSPYKIAQDSSGLIIFSDERDAVAEYRVLPNNPQIYPADYTLAFSLWLAVLMAPRLTKGDPKGLRTKSFELYRFEIDAAKTRALNEQQDEEEPEADWIAGR